jgi:hypothetical protein
MLSISSSSAALLFLAAPTCVRVLWAVSDRLPITNIIRSKQFSLRHQLAPPTAVSAKPLDDVFEIQSRFAKEAYDNHVAEVSKLGKMCAGLAENAYRPVERATREVE